MNNKSNKKSSFKLQRIDSEIKKELQSILSYDLQDKRIDSFVSVMDVYITKDLSNCKVYVQTSSENKEDVIKALNHANSFIKREIAARLNLRKTPDFNFHIDDSLENMNHIEELLKKINSN